MSLILEWQDDEYKVYWQNGAHIGYISKDVDGYFYWWPSARRSDGSWDSHALRTIADKLDGLNKEWHNEVQSYFKDSHEK